MAKSAALFAVEGEQTARGLLNTGLAALGHRCGGPPQVLLRGSLNHPEERSFRPATPTEEATAGLGWAGGARARLRLCSYRDGAVALAMDGALTNAIQLRTELLENGALFGDDGDSELILHLLAASDQKTFVNRLVDACGRLEGGFALVAMDAWKLVGCRDPWGLRPLCLGRYKSAFVLASEGAAILEVGGEILRELSPGEMVIIEDGRLEAIRPLPRRPRRVCSMELLSLGSVQSVLGEREVYAARARLGELLARKAPVRADVVLAMPGVNAAASAFARSLELIVENALSQTATGFVVARSVVKGRRVVVVGGPLLQAQPLQQVVRCLRAAQATEVHVRLAGPMVVAGCLYGVGEEEEPLWHDARSRMDAADLREFFEADSLVVLEAAAVLEALGTAEPGWCTACYTHDYPLTPPAPGPLGQLPLFAAGS